MLLLNAVDPTRTGTSSVQDCCSDVLQGLERTRAAIPRCTQSMASLTYQAVDIFTLLALTVC